MDKRRLDGFEDISGWTAVTSGQARLRISQDQGRTGKAMRLDFDFCGGGGFVVARKLISLDIPESYVFGFHVRGSAPPNAFEFKLVDETNENVWRYRAEEFVFPETWQTVQIRDSQIDFAWGPLGGGPPGRVAAVELVVAAGPGGRGAVWFDELWLRDETYRLTPVVRASNALPGHGPDHVLVPEGSWRTEASRHPQWLLIDFQTEREFGGLIIQWESGYQARQFEVEVSGDGDIWNAVYTTSQADTERSYLCLPRTVCRYVRIKLSQGTEDRGFGIRRIEVKPHDFSRTVHHFFQHIAGENEPGLYPKYFLRRQTYWTTVGTGESATQALMNEEGMVEVDKGSFSIEPFCYAGGRLFTWADVAVSQDLAKGYLPIPSSQWHSTTFSLTVTAFAFGAPPVLYVRYRIENESGEARPIRLFAVIRPFQVTPPWQQWRSYGGISPIHEMAFRDGMVRVNGIACVIPQGEAAVFGAAPFAAGGALKFLVRGQLPPAMEVEDESGYASGALRFDLDLEPGQGQEVFLAVPVGPLGHENFAVAPGPEALVQATRWWEEKLGSVELHLPPDAPNVSDSFKTCAAHILINRDGPALCPGPRRYSRAWIRDGAIMGAALIRAGIPEPLRDFIRWYARHQREDGNIPDCTGQEGAEWLPEFDAFGEFVFAVVEYYRFTGDRDFLTEMEPAASAALDFMEGLRAKRLTDEYRSPEKRVFYGLLPESMSHEGYMAHPVHAYWDDFWGVRGLRDGAFMAGTLGNARKAARLASLWDSFSENVRASLAAVIVRNGIDYVPGSVEHLDFDPTSTSIAVGLLDETQLLPPAQTANTFDRYVAAFRKRAAGAPDSNNYTAYEIRNIGALVRLARRDAAVELLEFMLGDRRIPHWNQWPEISWRDPSGPSFVGDLPHTWISAEYILALSSLFAYERGRTLVIAAGVVEAWLPEGFEVKVVNLPTYYGNLSYTLRLEGSTLTLRLQGNLVLPPDGIVVKPPLPRPLRGVKVNGRSIEDFEPDSFVVTECPADIVATF